MDTPEFKKLQKKWYKKLEDEDFNDVEQDEEYLKQFARIDTRYCGPIEAKIEYYRLATHFLNDYKFLSRFEYTIWMYHTEGISARNIAKILNRIKKRYKKKNIERMMIWRVISRLAKEMKLLYGIE